MPHAALRLRPGVDTTRTSTLNEASISTSQLIRFMPDSSGAALVQPIGGWTRFYPTAVGSPVRNLWAWEDINASKYLAVGAETSLGVVQGWSSLSSTGSLITITPQVVTDDPAVAVTTVAGSAVVTILDVGSSISSYDSVFIQTPISVGGLILYGLYPCGAVDTDNFTITAVDALNAPLPAPTSITAGGAVPEYTTLNGVSVVSVALADHGYAVGDTYPAYVSTTLNGVTISGDYTVVGVTSSSAFTIQTSAAATANGSAFVNAGNARYEFFIGLGPPTFGTGFGVGTYGSGVFGGAGSPTGRTGTPISATDWTLDNWGSFLVACPYGGPIYTWDPTQGQPVATIIPQAPVANAGVFVAMPERQIVAWGSTTNGIIDPLLVRWCEVQDFSVWVGQATNQAGQYRLPRGSRIVGGLQGPQQGLLWTDLGVWAMQYIGQPFIYGFNELGTGCGLLAPKGAALLNGSVFWISRTQFFQMADSGPKPIHCPVWDVIFQNLDLANIDKIRAAANAQFGEVAWYYPSLSGGGEVDSYVKLNTMLGEWDYGSLGRTAWLNQSVFGSPIGAAAGTNLLYQHETSTLADGAVLPASFTTGGFSLSEGEYKTFLDEVWPDFKWGYFGGTQNANVNFSVNGADFPSQIPTVYGPFTFTTSSTYITPRLRARLVSFTIESAPTNTAFWRLGLIRYRVAPDGKY